MKHYKSIVKCEYLKTSNGYVSGCGIRAAYNKFWNYCPYCGRQLMIINKKSTEA